MFIVERLISAIAPHVCIICGAEGEVVCAWCLPEIAPPIPERCYRCRAQTAHSQVCQKCRRQSRLGHVWVRTGYMDHARQLVHDFKFARKQAAAIPLARLMAECLPFLSDEVIVTHVPTATSRIRQRGYDHAVLLARALAREQKLPYAPLLLRQGKTRQVGASRKQRLGQLDGSFRPIKSEPLKGAHILLVDDIVTTGGTLEAAARCLKQAGAKQVDAVVFAQKE